MARYMTDIPANTGTEPHEANFKFDSHSDCLINITQSVIQDVFCLNQDVNEIRRSKVECAFPRTPASTADATAPEF
jgi:hypothetical protein